MKKASLQLSINAIVILVMAMVVLGLGISFIQGNMGGLGDKLTDVGDSVRIEHPATYDNPLTIDEEVELEQKEDTKVYVSFFNREESEVTLYLGKSPDDNTIDCTDKNNDRTRFKVSSGAVSVNSGEEKTLRTIISDSTGDDNPTGLYTCVLPAKSTQCSGECASTTFFLRLTS